MRKINDGNENHYYNLVQCTLFSFPSFNLNFIIILKTAMLYYNLILGCGRVSIFDHYI